MDIQAIIFDLDGVIVSTDLCHYKAWKRLAEEEGIYFDYNINQRLRGVSRMESLEIILENSPRDYSAAEKITFAARKNRYYQELIKTLTHSNILPGVKDFLEESRRKGIKIAIGSSSKNCQLILSQIGLTDYFDVTVDGNDISKSKPDPEVFLTAAKRLGIVSENCLVIEDAEAGVEAALKGGMRVLGVGSASEIKKATIRAIDLSKISITDILELASRDFLSIG